MFHSTAVSSNDLIQMSHSHLLRFTFVYGDKPPQIPLVPLRFFDTVNNPTPKFNDILDSGADEITIPRELAEYLDYKIIPRKEKINTAGGEMNAFVTNGDFSIGRGGREVRYHSIEMCVVDHDIPVLIGIKPLFDDYSISIQAYENKVVLTPRQKK